MAPLIELKLRSKDMAVYAQNSMSPARFKSNQTFNLSSIRIIMAKSFMRPGSMKASSLTRFSGKMTTKQQSVNKIRARSLIWLRKDVSRLWRV